MPTAYATNSAIPAMVDPARKLVTTIARNGPIVHDSDRPASGLRERAMPRPGNCRPASSHPPRPTSTSPTPMVTHGRCRCTEPATGAHDQAEQSEHDDEPAGHRHGVRDAAALAMRRPWPATHNLIVSAFW
jgi:hypothetical protein